MGDHPMIGRVASRMFKSKELPWLFLLAFCVAVAIGIAAFAIGAQALTGVQIAVAFVALAFGQLLLFIRLTMRNSMIEKDLKAMAVEVNDTIAEAREERGQIEELAAQISVLRSDNESFAQNIAQGMNQLHQSHATLAEYMKNALAHAQESQQHQLRVAMAQERAWRESQAQASVQEQSPPEVQQDYPAPQAAGEPVAPPEPTPYAQSLLLSLEPIVDPTNNQTAHYRLHFGMATENGSEVNQDILCHHADRAGLRPGLDLHLARECLALAQRLRKRDPALNIFMPIGAATLSSAETLQRILEIRKANEDAGAGVVFELAHVVLASLPASGLEGLATLARNGVTLSLCNANIAGLDLQALNKLNVRFVALPAPASPDQAQLQRLQEFFLAARAVKVQVMLTSVATAQQASSLGRFCRLACGAAFASPRRVKREQTMRSDYPAAAAE